MKHSGGKAAEYFSHAPENWSRGGERRGEVSRGEERKDNSSVENNLQKSLSPAARPLNGKSNFKTCY